LFLQNNTKIPLIDVRERIFLLLEHRRKNKNFIAVANRNDLIVSIARAKEKTII
jgi:phosphopantetheine adenylyltransferase